MQGRLLVLAGQLAHEELAAEQLAVHERAVLGQADLVGGELYPLCNGHKYVTFSFMISK